MLDRAAITAVEADDMSAPCTDSTGFVCLYQPDGQAKHLSPGWDCYFAAVDLR